MRCGPRDNAFWLCATSTRKRSTRFTTPHSSGGVQSIGPASRPRRLEATQRGLLPCFVLHQRPDRDVGGRQQHHAVQPIRVGRWREQRGRKRRRWGRQVWRAAAPSEWRRRFLSDPVSLLGDLRTVDGVPPYSEGKVGDFPRSRTGMGQPKHTAGPGIWRLSTSGVTLAWIRSTGFWQLNRGGYAW